MGIDATGYAAEAAFMPYAGRLADQPGGWTHFMWLLFVIACVGLVSTIMFLYRDHRAHQGPGGTPLGPNPLGVHPLKHEEILANYVG